MLRRHLSVVVLARRLAAAGAVVGARTGSAHRAVRSRAARARARPSSRPGRTRCRRGPKARDASASRTINTARSASTPTAAIWGRENRTFAVDLLYPGFIFDVPVNINLVVGRTARRVLFTNERFAYGADVPLVAATGEYTGYSGFRVRAPLNTPDYLDEFLVFQGASYFRARRERPAVRLVGARPRRSHGAARGRGVSRLHGLLDRAAAGASRADRRARAAAEPVGRRRVHVHGAARRRDHRRRPSSTLFPRVELTAFGIAPLTSMFLFDASNRARFDDYRSAVHDSDGLQIVNGRGERLWRPLANSAHVAGIGVSSTTARRASACCSASGSSRTTRTPRRSTIAGRRCGSSRARSGARGTSSSSRFRRRAR